MICIEFIICYQFQKISFQSKRLITISKSYHITKWSDWYIPVY